MVNNTTEQRWQPNYETKPSSVKSPLLDDKNPVQQVNIQPTIKTAPKPPIKPVKRLTNRQQAFIKLFIQNPTMPLYEIAKEAGYTGNYLTLAQMGSQNLKNPQILAELAKYSDTAEVTLVEVMNHSKQEMYKTDKSRSVDWANTARQSANDLLDRVHGKATIKTELSSRSVVLNIDLTGVASASEQV